jgi:DNA-binding transcriptional regulator YbjK
MKVYLEYGLAFVTKTVFTKKVDAATKKMPEFQEQYKRIMAEFQENLDKYTKKDLIKKYRGTHDVFQLGMTILILVLERNLNLEKVKDIIEKMTSLNNPITAKEAISLF